MYLTRQIRFLNRKVTIVIQDENGPCPLIALVNALILEGRVSIAKSDVMVSFEELVTLIGNKLLSGQGGNGGDGSANGGACGSSSSGGAGAGAVADSSGWIAQITSVMDILPVLRHGLDVNCRFDSVTGFEFMPELSGMLERSSVEVKP